MTNELLPSRDRLKAIVEVTHAFKSFLSDAALFDAAERPPIPASTIAYRRSQVIYRWHEWEVVLNPNYASWRSLPDVAAGGWRQWREVHLALADLHALRKELIGLWHLEDVVGATSVRPQLRAESGSSRGTLFIQAEFKQPSHAPAGTVEIEMTESWPTPLAIEWPRQCTYALQRLNEVLQSELEVPQSTNSRWSEGVFLTKAQELKRRLSSWQVEEYVSPLQFSSEHESRLWIRLTFGNIVRETIDELGEKPGKGLQFFVHAEGEDEHGCVGEVYENPERDTDRSLTQWLMGDFLAHLELTASSPPMDYLKGTYEQLLSLPAWIVRPPNDGEQWGNPLPDKHGGPRNLLVTGRTIPAEYLDNLVDAAEGLLRAQPVNSQTRLYLDDIDSFRAVRGTTAQDALSFLKEGRLELAEDVIKTALEEILCVPFHRKDSPNELNDIYTGNVIVHGDRRATAFLLKGPGLRKKEMTIADCGKHGDQLVRLFDSPADLFVIQFVGRVSEMVIKDVEGKIATRHRRGKPGQFVIIDGQDTARLLLAYGKLRLLDAESRTPQ